MCPSCSAIDLIVTAWQHRRGELRTQEQRKQYREDHPDEFFPLAVALTKEGVIASMDQLAEAIRTIDASTSTRGKSLASRSAPLTRYGWNDRS